MARPGESNPVRTGVFGITLVACLVLVSFGYTGLPFWPQGKNYEAYFTDAGGITPGNDVNVSGIKVGKVNSVELAGDSALVKFTADRKVRVGDQSLVAIKTDTVLGQKSLSVTPKGSGSTTMIPLGHLPRRLAELDASRELVVYCRSGVRSARAVAILREHGFTRVSNLSGGIINWNKELGKSL